MGEMKESHECRCSTYVGEEKERERWARMCVRKHIIGVTRFLSPDWSRR
jgi:hypothetical protein